MGLFGPRGCSCSLLIGLLGCVVLGLVGYTVVLPRFRDAVQDPVREAVQTEVARQIAIAPDEAPAPGTYTLNQDELNAALQEQAGGTLDLDRVHATLAPSGITVEITARKQTATYRGDVAAAGGRFRVIDMTVDGGFGYILPADDMAKILENSVNDYLASRGLRVSDARLGEGTLTLSVEPAG